MENILFLTMVIIIIIAELIQKNMKRYYKKYSKTVNSSNTTGLDMAYIIFNKEKLKNVQIIGIEKEDNCYNSATKTIYLSKRVLTTPTIIGVSISSHECGHASQDNEHYLFSIIRDKLSPISLCISYLYWITIFLVFFSQTENYEFLIILIFVIKTIIGLIAIPSELNASQRAVKYIKEFNVLNKKEIKLAKKILRTAASTYIITVIEDFLIVILYLLI